MKHIKTTERDKHKEMRFFDAVVMHQELDDTEGIGAWSDVIERLREDYGLPAEEWDITIETVLIYNDSVKLDIKAKRCREVER